MNIDVVMRCRNEMPFVPRAIDAIVGQRGVRPRIFFFDCGSTDGSREEASRRRLPIVNVDPSSYRPGNVLNRGMRATCSEVVAFVNADAIALDPYALEALVEPLCSGGLVAASFARQEVRADAGRITRSDQERAFGRVAPVSVARGAFFSMAASAVARTAWLRLPFDEELRYSEDIDWTHRMRALGLRIEYRPQARFEHSHEYSLGQHFRRRRGEGEADSRIFRLGRPSLWGELLRPFVGSLVRDLRQGELASLPLRAVQSAGGFAGRLIPVLAERRPIPRRDREPSVLALRDAEGAPGE